MTYSNIQNEQEKKIQLSTRSKVLLIEFIDESYIIISRSFTFDKFASLFCLNIVDLFMFRSENNSFRCKKR